MSEKILCPHCMEELPQGSTVCQHCGHSTKAENAANQLPVGMILNHRYLIGCALGGGGFGLTYAAYDRVLNIRVAIKEYYPSGKANRSPEGEVYFNPSTETEEDIRTGKEKFLREAQILSDFPNDENVVELRDFFETNGTAYIVMEYLEGKDLRQYSKENPDISYEAALELLSPVIDCLGRIHAKGIIHGDISPSNIMLLEDGGIKLIDFGAAREFGSRGEEDSSILLKPGYAPEEQYRPNGNLGPWTDVYAITATLYKLITGKTPESSLDRAERDNLKRPSMYGKKLKRPQEAALMKGLALKAENRFQDMAELKADLLGKGAAGGRRKKLAVIAAVAAVAVVIIGTATLGADKAVEPAVSTQDVIPAEAPQEEEISMEQSRLPEDMELTEDAYPIPLFEGMERIAGFEEQVLKDCEFYSLTVNDCFIGNNQLAFMVTIVNKSEDGVIFSPRMPLGEGPWEYEKDIDLRDFDGSYISNINLQPSEERIMSLWVNTNSLVLAGTSSFDELRLALSIRTNEPRFDYYVRTYHNYADYLGFPIVFPEIVELKNNFEDEPQTIYNGLDGLELKCYGLSLTKGYNSGELMLSVVTPETITYSVREFISIPSSEINVDGERISSSNTDTYNFFYETEIYTLPKEFVINLRFDYGYSSYHDEMSVYHSDQPFPEEIELKVNVTENNGTPYTTDTLHFTIDDEGIGRLTA